MRVISEDTYNFLFHPLNSGFSLQKRAFSFATAIALTAISFGVYGLFFAAVRLSERKYSILPKTPGKESVAERIIQKLTKKKLLRSDSESLMQSKAPINVSSSTLPSRVRLIKKEHEIQHKKFEEWAAKEEWDKIKSAHYDWWMFPISQDSSGYGSKYNVGKDDVAALKSDPVFMKGYRRGVELVICAWGWNLREDKPVEQLKSGQGWDGYGVRLAKMSESLKLFQEEELHRKVKLFFTLYCLPHQGSIPISDIHWLRKSFNIPA